jgi:uncharacterized protein YkwD
VKTWTRGLLCALALVFGLVGVGAARAQDGHAGAISPDEILARFNRERTRAGAPPVRLVPVLAQVAQQQAEEMARDGGWRLRSPSGEDVAERLRRAGYSARDWRQYFAFSEQEPPEAVLASRRAALDGRYRDFGVGTAVVHGVTLHVFLLGWHQGDYFAAATHRLTDPERIAAEMLARVNAVRRRAGLPPVTANPLLDQVSRRHAEDMLARSYSGHRTPEGLGPSERARAAGYRSGIGENIVEQRFSVEEALDAWLGSPGHRRNLLDPGCREIGLGLAVGAGHDAAPGGYRVIWVQSFGGG